MFKTCPTFITFFSTWQCFATFSSGPFEAAKNGLWNGILVKLWHRCLDMGPSPSGCPTDLTPANVNIDTFDPSKTARTVDRVKVKKVLQFNSFNKSWDCYKVPLWPILTALKRHWLFLFASGHQKVCHYIPLLMQRVSVGDLKLSSTYRSQPEAVNQKTHWLKIEL